MTPYGGGHWTSDSYGSPTGWFEGTFKCDSCLRLNIGTLYGQDRPTTPGDIGQTRNFWDRYLPTEWAPSFVKGQRYPDVPDHVARPASEAHKCRSINALMSSILMARAVIESVAKDHGITSGTLFRKIDGMHEAGLIDAFAKETAHTIRVFGNDMAHGDFTVDVDAADADGVLTFLDYILHGVYQSKAQLQRLKDSAAARAAAQAG
ncbi:DUF4145 domain-containing protein [Paenarthrobacter nicotinovorans]|uniref:DUF4145 domain-containing protein n=1 Tax=Paenarthrobacter nicotinovorans TaxID=29320 RepID=UPI0039A5996A